MKKPIAIVTLLTVSVLGMLPIDKANAIDSLQRQIQEATTGTTFPSLPEDQLVSQIPSDISTAEAETSALGEPLTINCQTATLNQQVFFFAEQDKQQIAVDCSSIVVPGGSNVEWDGVAIYPSGSNLELPTIEVPLSRESRLDRLELFRLPL